RGGARGDEAQGPAIGRRLLRTDRAANAQVAVGHGRNLYDLRPLPVHARAMDGGRRRRSEAISEGQRAPTAHVRAAERAHGDRAGARTKGVEWGKAEGARRQVIKTRIRTGPES